MDVVASNYGLAFSISPAKKRAKKDDEDDEEYTLTLAPFTKAPKINFGEVKLNTTVERTVLIVNPQQFEVKLNVTNQDLEINNMELTIGKQENISFKIKWQPEKPNNYKYSIMFEVTNSVRLKFLVHAFGVCVAPPQKKIRKPLSTFQPVKKDKPSSSSAIQPTNSVKSKPAIVTNSSKTILKPAIKKASTITATIKQPTATATTSYDKTFIVKQTPTIGAKLTKAPSVDIYNLYTDDYDQDQDETTIHNNNSHHHQMDIRRQTCIIASPKIVKNKDGTLHYITNGNHHLQNQTNNFTMRNMYMDDFNFKINEFQKTPIRRSLSSGGNLDTTHSFSDASLVFVAGGISIQNTTTNYLDQNQTIIPKNYSPSIYSTVKKQEYNEPASNLTPKLADFMKKPNLLASQTPKLADVRLATQLNYDYDEPTMNSSTEASLPLINSTILIMPSLATKLPIKIIVQLQKQWRMKKFRQYLRKLKIEMSQQAIREAMANTLKINEETRLKEQEKMIKGFVKLQLHFRMKKFRKFLSILKEQKLLKVCLMIQRNWRMKKFRLNLKRLRMDQQMNELNRLNMIIMCQRAIRMKLFRLNLNKLKQQHNRLVFHAINCQRIWRQKQFRSSLKNLQQKRCASVKIIANQWRLYKFRKSMNHYRNTIILIQKWTRSMKQRFIYLNLKRTCIQIQARLRSRQQQVKFKQIQKSVLVIQEWTRSKKDRFVYLKWKREQKSALIIQRRWRLFKFRSIMRKYKQAVCLIQKWHRSMKLRYEFLRKRDIICRIQALYRRVYLVRRHAACLKIQCAWRVFKAKRLVNEKRIEYEIKLEARREQDRLYRCAQLIQAYWRGYSVRKQTNQILNRIRNRLSCYIQSTSLSNYQTKTLGARIRNSLKILSTENIPIQQIMLALNDLDKVTCLSPECCRIFVREGALKILYTFLLNCNRSVIHMDLIKMCLKVLINLAKYNETVTRIIEEEPAESLFILSNLLYAYHSTNSVIFMNACILFILLAQCKPLNDWLLSQETLIKKLMGIHSTLERRTFLKLKQTNQINNPLSASKAVLSQQQSLNTSCSSVSLTTGASCSSISLVSNKKSITVSFHLEPEWSLGKKTNIELVDPIGALEYFLNCLKIKTDQSILKTPSKKGTTLNIVKELGSASKSTTSSQQRIPFSQKGNQQQQQQQQQHLGSSSSSRKLAFKQHSSRDENSENDNADFTLDENQVSICSNESSSTIKSIANSFFNEEPKLNSTSIISSTRQQTKQKQSSTQHPTAGSVVSSTKRKII